ncbi:MAG: phosphotransferase family protein [Promethearchaeota archaeon]
MPTIINLKKNIKANPMINPMINYEEQRDQDISQTKVFNSLRIFLPEIRKNQIKFLYHGTYNVFEVKNKYIFRFPDNLFRNLKGVQLINHEVKMLKFIQKYISIKIPEPIFISREIENPFFGYEKIDGISLSKCYIKSSKSEKIRIVKDISLFLSQLHSDRLVEKALSSQIVEEYLTPDKYKQTWQDFFDQIRVNVFSLMNMHQKNWVSKLFKSFLQEEKNFNFTPAIIHGDFDTSNILVDPKTFMITGIIDFEESRIFDPAADFIFYEEGDIFLKTLLSSYKGFKDENFRYRMKFLYGCTSLHYIKFGVENNINDMIKAGFQKLNHVISKFKMIK